VRRVQDLHDFDANRLDGDIWVASAKQGLWPLDSVISLFWDFACFDGFGI
jgi:hypothetical protein